MRNMANWDRLLRLIVVIAIAAAWYTGYLSGTAALVLGALAAVFLLTSAISFCPLYRVFGFTTAGKN